LHQKEKKNHKKKETKKKTLTRERRGKRKGKRIGRNRKYHKEEKYQQIVDSWGGEGKGPHIPGKTSSYGKR